MVEEKIYNEEDMEEIIRNIDFLWMDIFFA